MRTITFKFCRMLASIPRIIILHRHFNHPRHRVQIHTRLKNPRPMHRSFLISRLHRLARNIHYFIVFVFFLSKSHSLRDKVEGSIGFRFYPEDFACNSNSRTLACSHELFMQKARISQLMLGGTGLFFQFLRLNI